MMMHIRGASGIREWHIECAKIGCEVTLSVICGKEVNLYTDDDNRTQVVNGDTEKTKGQAFCCCNSSHAKRISHVVR